LVMRAAIRFALRSLETYKMKAMPVEYNPLPKRGCIQVARDSTTLDCIQRGMSFSIIQPCVHSICIASTAIPKIDLSYIVKLVVAVKYEVYESN